MANEEFMAFPQSRIDQLEAQSKAKAPYMSPHHPNARKTTPAVVASQMTTNIDTQRMGLPAQPRAVAAPVSVPEPGARIPVVPPGFNTPTSHEEAVLIALPSGYAFYDFKDLYIVPFKGRHMGKLSRAREEGSTLHTVEAVSSVLSTPDGRQHLAFDLTVPDFYYVLFWLRINSFTKTTFIHSWTCADEDHVQQVAEGKMDSSTLRHSEVITKASLKETLLTTIPNVADYQLEYPGASVRHATMRDALEMIEDPEFANEEFRYAAELATNLSIPDVVDPTDIPGAAPNPPRRATLRERVEVINDMSLEDHQTIRAYEKAISDYGITESVTVKCKHCKAKPHVEPIVLDAHCFFQSAR